MVRVNPGPVETALQGGDKRAILEAVRDRIGEEIDGVECCKCGLPRRAAGSETSALTLRLMQVLTELDALPQEGQVSRLDELAGKRDKRRTGVTDSPQSVSRRQGGRRQDTDRG